MAVKQSFNFLDNQRVDKPHLKAIESGILFDFKTLLQAFTADSPYILRGFDINNPGAAINGNASNVQVIVDAATIWMPSEADGSFLRVPAGTANETLNSANTKVTGSFTASAINYVSVKFSRATDPTTNDLVAFWDVDAEVEFTKTVPLGLVLNYQFVINTSGFGSNAPVAVITTDASNNVIKIDNAKNGMFRLGKGGASPNSGYNWAYSLNPENPLSLSTSGGPSPYAGGDWELKTFKDWMDAVMTEIKAMKGSAYWYSPGSSGLPGVNMLDTWFDSLGSTITGAGKFKHDNTTPGLVSWTSNIYLKSIIGPLTFTIPTGNITLNDGQVGYILLARNQDFQPANTFTFTNGSNTVTATANVVGISAGDWIKFDGHDIGKWAKVLSVAGTTVTLTANYQGANAIGKALSCQGSYSVNVANPESVPANSNVFWIAKRDDNAVPTATIDTPGNSGATRTSDIATITTTAPHGLVAGQTVSITGVSDPTFNNVAEILDTPTTTTFTYLNPGANVTAGLVGNGSVTVRARVYLRAIGELVQGEERQFDDNAVLNVLAFIGSESESDITPPYSILPNGLSPYTFTTNSNLTQAISATTGNVNAILTTLDQPSYDEAIEIVSGGTPVVQATQVVGGGPGAFIQASAERLAQSFTATVDNFLTSMVWNLRAVGSPDADILCDIYTDSSGQPGTLLATSTTTLAANTLTGSYANYQFDFSPVPLTSTVVYWLVLRVASVVTITGTDYIDAEDNNTNPYAGGQESKYDGVNWIAAPSSDFYFTINSLTLGTNQWPPMPAGTTITIPKNTRLTGSPQQNYVVGKGTLELYLNGQYLRLNAGNGWDEVGASLTNSEKVIIQQDLFDGDELIFRLDATGGPGSGGASAPDDNFITLPTEASADNADFVLIYDMSALAYKKQTRANFLAGLNGLRSVNTFSSNQTLNATHDHVRVDCTSGNITITLPLASLNIGVQYTIKKIDASANSVIINPGTDLIDGSSSLSWNVQYQSFTIVASAAGTWDIV